MEHKTGPIDHLAPARRGGGTYVCVRGVVEWVGALAMLVVALPLMGGVAAAVALTSPGPVFYSQMRLGKGGRPFRIYKFRTMRDRCEAATGPVWSTVNDPRVTRVGKWLRDTHIDELPQLWNVLRGEMSLIGPRPERPEIAAKIERALPEFRERLRVRPGLSGLAQVLLPPDADIQTVQNKLAHDLEYLRSAGPGLDLRIALATVLCLARLRPGVAGWPVRHFACFPPLKMSLASELPVAGAASTEGVEEPITAEAPLAA